MIDIWVLSRCSQGEDFYGADDVVEVVGVYSSLQLAKDQVGGDWEELQATTVPTFMIKVDLNNISDSYFIEEFTLNKDHALKTIP